MPSRNSNIRRDLPMPASPLIPTIWPWPRIADSRRDCSRSISRWRPTKAAARSRTPRPTARRPTSASARPCPDASGSSWSSKPRSRNGAAVSLITTPSGSARAISASRIVSAACLPSTSSSAAAAPCPTRNWLVWTATRIAGAAPVSCLARSTAFTIAIAACAARLGASSVESRPKAATMPAGLRPSKLRILSRSTSSARPTVVVPFLRPYRTREDMGGWHADGGVAEYVEERLKRGIYRGIGEFHLGGADVDAPVVRRIAELAAERDLFLHAHVDADTIEKLLARYPKVRFLWAHAGMSADAETVGRPARRHYVAPGGRLDPAWRARFLRHADRFLVGTDTWVTSRWEAVEPSMRDVQQWLAELPAEVAERIAWKNGARLFPAP